MASPILSIQIILFMYLLMDEVCYTGYALMYQVYRHQSGTNSYVLFGVSRVVRKGGLPQNDYKFTQLAILLNKICDIYLPQCAHQISSFEYNRGISDTSTDRDLPGLNYTAINQDAHRVRESKR